MYVLCFTKLILTNYLLLHNYSYTGVKVNSKQKFMLIFSKHK